MYKPKKVNESNTACPFFQELFIWKYVNRCWCKLVRLMLEPSLVKCNQEKVWIFVGQKRWLLTGISIILKSRSHTAHPMGLKCNHIYCLKDFNLYSLKLLKNVHIYTHTPVWMKELFFTVTEDSKTQRKMKIFILYASKFQGLGSRRQKSEFQGTEKERVYQFIRVGLAKSTQIYQTEHREAWNASARYKMLGFSIGSGTLSCIFPFLQI